MCGIVGAVARRDILPILIEGLRRLEYRGYDSCGIAVVVNNTLMRARSITRIGDLIKHAIQDGLHSGTGIAHTRWATHGVPVTHNAHPIFSRDTIGVVHNGVIENYEELQIYLRRKGYEFESQTDTEVIAHLIHSFYQRNLHAAVNAAVKKLRGAYAIAVISKNEPHRIIGARVGLPLVVGIGDKENFLASDTLALGGITDRFSFLEEGDIADLSLDKICITDINGRKVEREVRWIPNNSVKMQLGSFQHFMKKEIFEQPRAIIDTIQRIEMFDAGLFGCEACHIFKMIDGILILACGTSYYSGLCAKHWIEGIAHVPTQVEIASEYRYRKSVPRPNDLVLVISQSGETADTISALKHAKELGHAYTLAICNSATSTMVRMARMVFLTQAGIEIGVASTKAFTTQLVALFVFAVTLGKLKRLISIDMEEIYLKQLHNLPEAINVVLSLESKISIWSKHLSIKENALFLGRGLHYPIALEGALKLKEISYIHAEAYPAGELKHGPLALVTKEMPVVVVAPNDALLGKLKSNIQEVHARGGQLYVFTDADSHILSNSGLRVIQMPGHYGILSPILYVVPMQLLAYHTACEKGTDIDKPRNLAKSVTVE